MSNEEQLGPIFSKLFSESLQKLKDERLTLEEMELQLRENYRIFIPKFAERIDIVEMDSSEEKNAAKEELIVTLESLLEEELLKLKTK